MAAWSGIAARALYSRSQNSVVNFIGGRSVEALVV
jgi:hypothetical protein